jgi:putative ABC transport system permease protein
VLVIVEMALAVVLLVGAGLLTRSFLRLLAVDPGYTADNVVTMTVALPSTTYPWDQQMIAFGDQVLDRLRHAPGVSSAALAYGRPLEQAAMHITFARDDRPPPPPDKQPVADIRVISPEFFSALRIPIVSGRALLPSDRSTSPQVVLVSQSFARTFYPDENPIGKHVTVGMLSQRSANPADTVHAGGEIVGVAHDIDALGARTAPPQTIYLPFDQTPINYLSVLVRSALSPSAAISAARQAIGRVDPSLPVFDTRSMRDVVSESVSQPRFYTVLLGSFAAIALFIAALGIYGIVSYSVTQRTRELGIRIALGAPRERVVRLVTGQGMGLTAIGVVIGLAAAGVLTRVIASLLFGVERVDALTFAAVAVVLLVLAWIASYIPARRAAAVDPIIAMRAD